MAAKKTGSVTVMPKGKQNSRGAESPSSPRGKNFQHTTKKSQNQEDKELNALFERMAHSLDRMHEMAQEVVTDLRAIRHSLGEESRIEHS